MPIKGELLINCPDRCSFHPDKIGKGPAHALMMIRANGAGGRVMCKRAEELLGHPINASTMQRHIGHYRYPEETPAEELPVEKLGDLDILDRIIQQGARNSHNWKPSIKDTIEAMKLKMQITGNSAFDDMLRAMEEGLQLAEGVSEEDLEAPEAIFEAGERAEDEYLPDPVL